MLTKEQSVKDCQGKDKVWVLEGDVFKALPVTIGISNGMLTEIKSGIKAGQKVITEFKMGASDEEESDGAKNNNPFIKDKNNHNIIISHKNTKKFKYKKSGKQYTNKR